MVRIIKKYDNLASYKSKDNIMKLIDYDFKIYMKGNNNTLVKWDKNGL
jgi:hypothetical protein